LPKGCYPNQQSDRTASINTGKPTLSYDCDVNGWMVGEGAGAVVLKRYERAKYDRDRIYATLDAVSLMYESTTSLAESVRQTCQKAFDKAGVCSTDIGYLEVFGSGVEQQDEAEIQGLIQAYQVPNPELSCAIGSVKANIGHTYVASGIASLIKTALCLYNRFIPATPQWSSPKWSEIWHNSPFYVATESRPWFLTEGLNNRVAAINSLGSDGTYAHAILSEDFSQKDRSNSYLQQAPFYLFPIAANDQSGLLAQLDALEQTIKNSSSLSAAASQTFATFQRHSQTIYALAIVGQNKDELLREGYS
jgi:acyl transferase domain-containing protein